ncbi:MAG: undecaprenyldiphospho-muramoylpentapeptide beta-N-acetylglucosaminyltransferase [Ignavibacteriaceae bacterium]
MTKSLIKTINLISLVATKRKTYRFLFAGGGTGGHLFPAVAVAEKIRIMIPEADILFVGTKSKIEGSVVPKLGFKFKPIWIKGFSRKLNFDNFLFPLKLIVSVFQSIFININYKPLVAIGSGGYVSGPAIFGSNLIGAKIILLEQNSYPGVTTRLLERYADEIHISFEDSKKYFKDKKKLLLTGNPVRENLSLINKNEALKEFNLVDNKKTLLILGGSLGAASINEAVAEAIEKLVDKDIQIIWQTGKNYYDKYKMFVQDNVLVKPFIESMNSAYSACDLLISRAGATTIAEVTALSISAVLVPSPNVAENHQYYNAKSLADKNAAVLVEDKNLKDEIAGIVINLIFNDEKLENLKTNAGSLSKRNATSIIANNIIKYTKSV